MKFVNKLDIVSTVFKIQKSAAFEASWDKYGVIIIFSILKWF